MGNFQVRTWHTRGISKYSDTINLITPTASITFPTSNCLNQPLIESSSQSFNLSNSLLRHSPSHPLAQVVYQPATPDANQHFNEIKQHPIKLWTCVFIAQLQQCYLTTMLFDINTLWKLCVALLHMCTTIAQPCRTKFHYSSMENIPHKVGINGIGPFKCDLR